jgi:hypothetical protein
MKIVDANFAPHSSLATQMINRLNMQQRIGAALVSLLIVGALCLHNPTDGYEWDYQYSSENYQCSTSQAIEWRRRLEEKQNRTAAEDDSLKRFREECALRTYTAALPIGEWKSHGAISHWFGRVVNVIWLICSSLILGGVWIWIFKDKPQNTE